jgi:hypothetical protein
MERSLSQWLRELGVAEHISSVSGMTAEEPFAKPVDVAAVIPDTLLLNEAAFAAPPFLFLSCYGEKYRRDSGKSNLKSD